MTIRSNCSINFENRGLTQSSSVDNNSNLLSLPPEVIQLIAREVSNEPSKIKSAIRAVELGRTCICFHQLTHDDDRIDALIHSEEKFNLFFGFVNQCETTFGDENTVFTRMSLAIEENSFESYRKRHDDMFQDYLRDSPGLDEQEAREKFVYEIKIYGGRNEDLPKIFYTIFRKAICGGEHLTDEAYVEKAKDMANEIDVNPSLREDFLQKIYRDMAKRCVNNFLAPKRSLGEYNASYAHYHNETTDALCNSFSKISWQRHEQNLRDGYENLHKEIFPFIKESLRKERADELTRVKDTIHWLCGNNFNGEIDTAYRRTRDAEIEMNNAKAAYKIELQKQVESISTSQERDVISNNQMRINDVYNDYAEKLSNHEESHCSLWELKHQLMELAVWTNGVITGGRKVELEAILGDPEEKQLTADALVLSEKISEFYAGLSNPINEASESAKPPTTIFLYDYL